MLKRSKNIIFISIGLHSEKSSIIEMEMGPWCTRTPSHAFSIDRTEPIWPDPLRFDSIQSNPFTHSDSWRKSSEQVL